MGGNNSVLLLNMVYCAAAATKIQTTGTSGEESLFTRVLAIALCASLLVFSARFLRESYSDFYRGACLTSLVIFQGACLGVRVGRKTDFFFFFICVLPFTSR